MLIQIGVQDSSGYPKECYPYFSTLHGELNEAFEKYVVDDYFKTIEKFWMGWRISGKFADFGHDGPEKMRYARKRNLITIDLSFPESSWKYVHPHVLHHKIITGVEECIRLMTERAIKEKEFLDLEGFQRDVKKALDECRDPTKFDYGTLVEKYATIPYK